MEEAQRLADRVAIIAAGRIVAEGRPDELGGREAPAGRIRFRLPAGVAAAELPAARRPAGRATASCSISHQAPVEPLNRAHRLGARAAIDLDGLQVSRPSLEDVYLELTGAEAATTETEPHERRRPGPAPVPLRPEESSGATRPRSSSRSRSR